ncbi:hypothetical protein [Pseudoxanthomonas composti]|uniref:Uncharacterized protein n=1 Tax=Pseudoxanthomonas composti TaxID=2137479 RepID=A0A4Q1JUH4_9GAMM|nr:hypothetical protein [Pseudoxanthomonas composti]RXR05352.1 hypothetical protein EPA99_11475 [Pseudoxanthomonas composti]
MQYADRSADLSRQFVRQANEAMANARSRMTLSARAARSLRRGTLILGLMAATLTAMQLQTVGLWHALASAFGVLVISTGLGLMAELLLGSGRLAQAPTQR